MEVGSIAYYLGVQCVVQANLPNNETVISVRVHEMENGGSMMDPPEYYETSHMVIVPTASLSVEPSLISTAERATEQRHADSVARHKADISDLRAERDLLASSVNKLRDQAKKNADTVQGIQNFLDLATGNFSHVILCSDYKGPKIMEKAEFDKWANGNGYNSDIRMKQYRAERTDKFVCIHATCDTTYALTACDSYENAIQTLIKMIKDTDKVSQFLECYLQYKALLDAPIAKYEDMIIATRNREQKDIDEQKRRLLGEIETCNKRLEVLYQAHKESSTK